MFHPVTTEIENIGRYSKSLISSLIDSNYNYIIIYPNNDLGSQKIIENYSVIKQNKKFKIYPSIRLEHFLVILKNSKFIIGNSSAGIREAPYYNVPIINIGSRQKNRAMQSEIINTNYTKKEISAALKKIDNYKQIKKNLMNLVKEIAQNYL